MKAKAASAVPCVCCSVRPIQSCCGPILAGERAALTAEALMRSRYAAFVVRDDAYLLRTWHPDTRPAHLDFQPRQRWLGLKIIATTAGTADDEAGTVEFVARHKIDGTGHRLHEVSRFVLVNGGWFYLDGVRGATDSSRGSSRD